MRTVRVAAIQATPVILDAEACVAKAVKLLGDAAAEGAELAVLPETFVPLYPSNRWAKGAAGFSCPSATAWPYTPTTQPYTSKLGYDAAHRQVSATDPLGRTSASEYDANGWVGKTIGSPGFWRAPPFFMNRTGHSGIACFPSAKNRWMPKKL